MMGCGQQNDNIRGSGTSRHDDGEAILAQSILFGPFRFVKIKKTPSRFTIGPGSIVIIPKP